MWWPCTKPPNLLTCFACQVTKETEEEGGGDETEVGGALQPVDVDFNLIKNLLESYTSQEGGAGPTSNILQSLGVHIPEQDNER